MHGAMSFANLCMRKQGYVDYEHLLRFDSALGSPVLFSTERRPGWKDMVEHLGVSPFSRLACRKENGLSLGVFKRSVDGNINLSECSPGWKIATLYIGTNKLFIVLRQAII